ncbi:ABC transporter ATP-binding protein [Agrobacterium sp. SORGH_AS 787]|uniref:ABC transporter ATP-binding protein n=1 Tax=Agrobacterium sp. SORGH_AS 787 TaxID=3041775 RepID=UPI002783E7B9|nr:peptide/nickel transport system ATP-binding protein [Rhizobium sp. SORGH_AS_0787]
MKRETVLHVSALKIGINGRQIVSDVEFSIAFGERVCLLGASGSGKSMTAAAILGLAPPLATCSGSVRIKGREVLNVRVPQRTSDTRLAMVFQDTHSALNPLISIGSQLEQPLRIHCGLTVAAARQASRELLASIGLPPTDDFLRSSAAEISGGQRQRVCIALALACRADLIVADEPTTALDVVAQAQVLDVLNRVTGGSEGPGLLLITHDISAASRVCERAIVLADGRIVEEGTIDEVLNRPHHPFTCDLVDCAFDAFHILPAEERPKC